MPTAKPAPQFKSIKPQRPYHTKPHIPPFHTKVIHYAVINLSPGNQKLRPANLSIKRNKSIVSPWHGPFVKASFNSLGGDKHLFGKITLDPVSRAHC